MGLTLAGSMRGGSARAAATMPSLPRGAWWPTPSAGRHNADEHPRTWLARHDVQAAREDAGRNNTGLPLAIAVQLADPAEDVRHIDPIWCAMLMGWPPLFL